MTETAAFVRDGFIGPIKLLTPAQCALVMRYCRLGDRPPPMEWEKGRAMTEPFLYDLATDPQLLARLRSLIGPDIVLWGLSVIERDPGQVHPWHTDIESSAPDHRFASVWIGLENTSRESALKVISRSHNFGATLQQVQSEGGRRRGEASDEVVLRWARERDGLAACRRPEMTDGDGIIFDGRLWHGSDNNQREGRRFALLLQYGAADAPVRMPDLDQLEWPFRLTRQVPVVVVCGQGNDSINRLMPAPQARREPSVATVVCQVPLPAPSHSNEPWQPFGLFHAPTPLLGAMACHASTLAPGHSPHPLHAHVEEELLIAIDGKAEIVIGDDCGAAAVRTEYLNPGDFVYYPTFRYHTIRNPQASRITYLMFKWQGAPNVNAEPLQAFFGRSEGIRPQLDSDPFRPRVLLEHPTAYLRKLHAHVTDLRPGDGYDPHADDHDVAIVLLSGKVETLGRIVEPLGVIYYAAGELHGMCNVGDRAARYLAFEFHAEEHRRFGTTSTKACPQSVVIPAPVPPTDDALVPSRGRLPSWKRLLQAPRDWFGSRSRQ